jgi:hypothetical protein
LILDDGRLMQLGANAISVGAAATGRGTVIVDGTAVLGTTSALTVGSTTGGAGDILITGGGRVEAGGVNLRPEGNIRIDKRDAAVSPRFNSIGGGRVQFDRGTVELTGTITLDSPRLDALLGPVARARRRADDQRGAPGDGRRAPHARRRRARSPPPASPTPARSRCGTAGQLTLSGGRPSPIPPAGSLPSPAPVR